MLLCLCTYEYRMERKSMYGCPHVDLTAAMDMRRGDYHKLFFCRNILGIDECKEEKRLLQSLAVRRFLTSLCVSIFLLAERYEKRKRRVREGRGGILRWRRHSLAWALDIKRWAKDVTNEADADTMIRSLLSLYHFGSGSANQNQKSFISLANRYMCASQ